MLSKLAACTALEALQLYLNCPPEDEGEDAAGPGGSGLHALLDHLPDLAASCQRLKRLSIELHPEWHDAYNEIDSGDACEVGTKTYNLRSVSLALNLTS